MKVPKSGRIAVEVRSRDKLFFDGEALGISGFDARGQFDVLPRHSNMVSVIREKIILYLKDGGVQEIPVSSGVMQVVGGKVRVFLGEVSG